MLNVKKTLTKILGIANGSHTYNTNNGTLYVEWYRCLNVVFAVMTIRPSSSWGTGSSNRITCTLDSNIPLPSNIANGTELNGIFVHISGQTFRAQNNTGGTLAANSNYNPSIVFIGGGTP